MTTETLPPLPDTIYGLFYESGDAFDGDGTYQEFVDEPGYTAEQMRAYARAAIDQAPATSSDNGITVSLLELLSKTSMRLGIASPESIETFGATLPRRLYALCRGVESLLDQLPPKDKAAAPLSDERVSAIYQALGITFLVPGDYDRHLFTRTDDVTLKKLVRAVERAHGIVQLRTCAANSDGDCIHSQCPQLRDGEPRATGRHCPLDV